MSTVHLAVLSLAVAASASDLRRRRIPNVLTFGAAAGALGYHLAAGGMGGLVHSTLGWLVGALVFIMPFALRGIGGGDIKLLGALGAWLGPADALWLALYTGVAGGVAALAVSAVNGCLRHSLRNIRLLVDHWQVAGLSAAAGITLDTSTGPRLPYALSILIGTLVTLWLEGT
jgi:prepilin peptidase CpaA